MSAIPNGDRGPVRRIAIRIDGAIVAEAIGHVADGIPVAVGSGSLTIQALIPLD